jgi:hypothetical protein
MAPRANGKAQMTTRMKSKTARSKHPVRRTHAKNGKSTPRRVTAKGPKHGHRVTVTKDGFAVPVHGRKATVRSAWFFGR